MVSPVVPGLTDHEMESVLTVARDADAVAANWIMLCLPREAGPLFRDWLAEHYPDRASQVMARVREVHGGRDYDPGWSKRMTGQWLYADLIRQRFRVATARLGFDRILPPLRTDLFRIPRAPSPQLPLFPDV